MGQVTQSPEHVETEVIEQPATMCGLGVDSDLDKLAVKGIFRSNWGN